MQKVTALKAGLGAATALALSLGVMTPAHADVQPTSSDAVGVGSDTVQYVDNFLDDGQSFLAVPALGFNTISKPRIFSFDASGDANGRAAYQSGTTTPLSATVVLRAGTKPQTRPNGSSAGITALLNDTTHKIDFARSSRAPKSSECTTGQANFGGLHDYKIATDGMQLAVNNITTNVPAGNPATIVPTTLTKPMLTDIYSNTAGTHSGINTWAQLEAAYPGSTASIPAGQLNDGIVPIAPQDGSGTLNDFLSDLGIPSSAAFKSSVVRSEEHDPVAINNIPTGNDVNGNPRDAADALAPFSTGRFNLIEATTVPAGGYFSASTPQHTIALLPTSTYFFARTFHILVRENDRTSTTPFVAGTSVNLVNTFFGTATSWYAKNSNASLYTAAGVTKAYQDLGVCV